ncbi:hypothetical protein SAMN04489810_1096 [Microbacterium pygmaeum]|uniref:Uncharacterized protein n=1 Tax=Microbacterium pygmaeum TaxID=370764 RepID=A0A1G7WJ54_9MICO|nr:hypothetical protein SAMN04489810_1096 [Microbacterium pygmaeum]
MIREVGECVDGSGGPLPQPRPRLWRSPPLRRGDNRMQMTRKGTPFSNEPWFTADPELRSFDERRAVSASWSRS